MNQTPAIDRLTIAGLALLLMPLVTITHEIGGHAGACLATGGQLRELGAFYVDCAAPGAAAQRIVAVAGVAADAVAAILAFAAWRVARGDMARLVAWYLWLCFGFSAAGYFLFSGIAGIGDLSPLASGGIGPLANPWLWRVAFAVLGGLAYVLLVKRGTRGLAAMIGQGPQTRAARQTVAHLFYGVLCLAAVQASIPNPVGLFITLASAGAASLGGKAGLISIGFATRAEGQAQGFTIARSVPLFVAGLAATLAFAALLGPTLQMG